MAKNNWGGMLAGAALGAAAGYGTGLRESGAAMREAELARIEREHEVGMQDDRQAHDSGESQLGRDFDASESQLGRDFDASESQLGRDFDASENQLGREHDYGLEDVRHANDLSLEGARAGNDRSLAKLNAELEAGGDPVKIADEVKLVDTIRTQFTTKDEDGVERFDPQGAAAAAQARGLDYWASIWSSMPAELDPDRWRQAEEMAAEEAESRDTSMWNWFSSSEGYEGDTREAWQNARAFEIYSRLGGQEGGGMLPDGDPGTVNADEAPEGGDESGDEGGNYPEAPVSRDERTPGQIYSFRGRTVRWVVDEQDPNGAWEVVE